MIRHSLIVAQIGGLTDIFAGTWPLLMIMVVFYFFFIRPQSKKTKEQANFIQNLAKGDEVVTASGIVGRIVKIEDHFAQLQVDNKTFLKVTKSAISKEMSDVLVTDTKE